MPFDIALRDNGAGTFDVSLTGTPAAITASLSVTDGADVLASAGTATVPTFIGTATITDGADSIVSSGAFAPLPVTGSVTITDEPDQIACTANSGGAGGSDGGMTVGMPLPWDAPRPPSAASQPMRNPAMRACILACGAGVHG